MYVRSKIPVANSLRFVKLFDNLLGDGATALKVGEGVIILSLSSQKPLFAICFSDS